MNKTSILDNEDYKPWYQKENYTAHYTNGDGFISYDKAEELCKDLPELHMFMHDSGMLCTHNIPCGICKTNHAVFVSSGGYCEPCRDCQDLGWSISFKKPSETILEGFINWLSK